MITISPSAVEHIQFSANESDAKNLKLRIAAKVAVDESIEYGMGFDEQKDDDIIVSVGGVEVLIDTTSSEHLNGAHLDFVEIESGQFSYIFLNPNDPNYKPPSEID